MENKVYLYYSATNSFGVNVIIDQFLEACKRCGKECCPTTSLDGLPVNSNIIPYGIKEAWGMRRKGYTLGTVFLVDAISLGFRNMVKFLVRKGDVFNREFIYSILAYIKYSHEERIISREAKKLMLVSKTDVAYLKKISKSKAEFLIVPNGANFPPNCTTKSTSSYFRLGILSSWGSPRALEENKWFLDTYFPKYAKRHSDVILYLAGRGPLINKFNGRNRVEILGEVGELNEFFSQIDVFLSVNPKGCGILNRVLDAFAHKTAVVGIDSSFSGFNYMSEGSYAVFSNYKEFEKVLDKLKNDSTLRVKMQNEAFGQISKFNQWEKNYDKFIEELDL